MVLSAANPSTPIPTIRKGTEAQEEDTKLSLSDTDSTMTKPQLPIPHKHQIHVLIIGMPT